MASFPSSRPLLTSTLRTVQKRHISAYGYEQAKALTFRQHGEPKDILSLHSHSISPAHSNLLTLRFLASPLNPADINQLQGVYPSKPSFTTSLGTSHPIAVGGNEGVAEVLAVGERVTRFRRGDWVIPRSPGFGTWRTHAQTAEDGLLRLEDTAGIQPVQAATVSVNPCTAWCMLRNFAALREGDWFVQNAANSGVGRAAVQLGRLWGLRSINVVRDREGGAESLKDELRELGADVVVTETELQERGIRDRVAEWTDGGRAKIRLGLNCVGGKGVTAMAKLLDSGAHLVTYGAMSKQPVTLPTGLLIFKDIHFDGFWVSRWSERHPDEKARMVHEILDLYRAGKLKDTPYQEIKWEWETKVETLVEAVQGTLEGYRKGKGIFVFGKT